MSNRDIIRQRALEKLDKLLKSALQNYEAEHDLSALNVVAENCDFTEEEYREIRDHIESINMDKSYLLSSCIYRGLDVSPELIPDNHME